MKIGQKEKQHVKRGREMFGGYYPSKKNAEK
jgi:hypothetical protein